MKSEKGITLTSLVVYIIVATIVIGTMAIMSSSFIKNIKEIHNQQNYAPELNQFAMFFLQDAKNNQTATVTENTVTFADKTTYRYEKNQIYRNDSVVASKVDSASFTLKNKTIHNTEKYIIEVKFQSEEFNQTMHFVLRYW
ncbi:MAG: hypothetical protein IJ777_00685 [Clostridia bacterium]|nr:hypothetical protein [Clostridia bacterium]